MKHINLNNLLTENSLILPKEVRLGVVSLPSGLSFSDKIEKIKKQKKHANMKFTFSNPSYSGKADKFEWANSAIIFTYDYMQNKHNSNLASNGFGKIAAFAEQDYYEPLKKITSEFENLFSRLNYKFHTFIDNPNHYDRTFFEISGLGWQGKSTMMLSPGIGPWQLLGTMYSDQHFEPTESKNYSCGECNLCQISCPTGALDEDYILDSNKCLSYWLQSPETIPYEIRTALGNRFYGCDECLTSCPPGQNKNLTINRINSYDVDLERIIISRNEDLLEKYNWFYIPKRNANYLKRNAIIALSNNPNHETYEFYLEVYKTLPDDLKNYILWGFWKLGKINEITSLMDKENSNDLKLEYQKLKSMTS